MCYRVRIWASGEMTVALFLLLCHMDRIRRHRTRDKELHRLIRSELLEKLIAQTGKKHQLKIRLRKAEAQFRDRK